MYLPQHFAETRDEELHRIIRENPLGMLVTHSSRGLDANRIPFEFESAPGAPGRTAMYPRGTTRWCMPTADCAFDDEKFLRSIVGRLTRRHEASEPKPWKMSDAPRDYMSQMLQAIVGIEVEVLRLEGKRKLGQNRDARDFEGAVRALHERGNNALSCAMANTRR